MGSLLQTKNTLFITTPGKDYGQGGLFTQYLGSNSNYKKTSRSRDFENREVHKQFRDNRENSKENGAKILNFCEVPKYCEVSLTVESLKLFLKFS